MTNDTPTTDRFGHAVPTREEMGDEHPDEARDAIEAEMDERLIAYYQR